eukprot:5150390-Pyramimonas_sp.AAC.1
MEAAVRGRGGTVQVYGYLWPLLHCQISAGTEPVRGRTDARSRCAARSAPRFALLSTKDPQGDPPRRSAIPGVGRR